MWHTRQLRQRELPCVYMTDWVKERIVTIPSCGPRQLCVVAGVRRTIPGKPIRCRIYSQLQASLGRNRLWKMEIGDGCECKAACFNSFAMQDYTGKGYCWSGTPAIIIPAYYPSTVALLANASIYSSRPQIHSFLTYVGIYDYFLRASYWCLV